MPTLDWIGKRAVLHHHRRIPLHLLKPDKEHSVGDSDAENLIVQADNLLALKALLPYYERSVKCIYIDPPYNTGEEKWVYNDNVNAPEIREWLNKVVGKEAEDLSRHDKWLCMMYPRLQLLKRFLTDDGVIFVSIDDNELANLLLVMREVFGPQNEIASIVWEKGKKGDSTFFSVTHEYIVAFARNKGLLKSKLTASKTKWRRRKAGVDEVLAKYDEVRTRLGADHDAIRKEMMAWFKGLPKGHPAKKQKHYNWSDDRGLYFPDNFHGPDDGRENRPRYDIPHPTTGQPCAKPRTGWRWEEETTLAALAEQPPRIHFGKTHKTIPNIKKYLFEVDEEAFPSVFYKDGRAATKHLEELLGEDAFDFPKDHVVLSDLIGLVAGKKDLILDSFGGSGTTAEAVMSLNRADRGSRRYILVEMDPDIATRITSRRVREVIAKERALRDPNDASAAAPLGFQFCRLGLPLFDESGGIRDGVRFNDLAAHVFFSDTGTPLAARNGKSPLLGVHNGVGVYLLFNGILGDLRPEGGNVLTSAVLAALPPHDGPKVIYAERCTVSDARLARERVTFKQTPYEIKVR